MLPAAGLDLGSATSVLNTGLVCDGICAACRCRLCRAGGAQLSNLAISGCNGRAVDVDVDATGTYTSPAVLTNITINANNGTQGAALYVGPAAAATLQVTEGAWEGTP